MPLGTARQQFIEIAFEGSLTVTALFGKPCDALLAEHPAFEPDEYTVVGYMLSAVDKITAAII